MCAARSVGSGDSCVVDATTALMMCVTAQGESGFRFGARRERSDADPLFRRGKIVPRNRRSGFPEAL